MVKRFSASRLTRVLYDRSIDVFNQFFAFIFFSKHKIERLEEQKQRNIGHCFQQLLRVF